MLNLLPFSSSCSNFKWIVSAVDLPSRENTSLTARNSGRLPSTSSAPSLVLSPRPGGSDSSAAAERGKVEEWKKAEELRLLDAEIALIETEKKLKKKFPDSSDLRDSDVLLAKLKELKKKKKALTPSAPAETPKSSSSAASTDTDTPAAPVAAVTIPTIAPPAPDPSAPAPPPLPPAGRSASPQKKAVTRRKSVSREDSTISGGDADTETSSQESDGSAGPTKRSLKRSASVSKRKPAVAGKKMARPASTARMDPAALKNELAGVVGRSLLVKTDSFLRSSEQPLNEEIAYGKFDYPEHDIFFYRDNFLRHPDEFSEVEKGKKFFRIARYMRIVPEDFHDHLNVFAVSSDKENPEKMVISIKRTPDEYDNYVGIIRSKLGDQPLTIGSSELKRDKRASGNPGAAPAASTKEIMTALRKQFPMFSNFKLHASDSIEFPSGDKKAKPIQLGSFGEKNSFSMVPVKHLPVDLLQLDRTLKVQAYKFGIVYVRKGQEKEKQYFGNKEADCCPEFWQFVEFLGQKIALKGWRGYRGDLDNRENTTGTHSIYTEFEDLEIMFHVAPLLPSDTRQRLIGNDIVAVIFLEPGVVWNPESIVSQVIHAQIIVQPSETRSGELGFRIDSAIRDGVPSTRPSISPKKVYELDDDLRDVLLRKMVNCERASWHCSKTVRAQTRSLQEHYGATRQGQLDFLIERYIDTAKEF